MTKFFRTTCSSPRLCGASHSAAVFLIGSGDLARGFVDVLFRLSVCISDTSPDAMQGFATRMQELISLIDKVKGTLIKDKVKKARKLRRLMVRQFATSFRSIGAASLHTRMSGFALSRVITSFN